MYRVPELQLAIYPRGEIGGDRQLLSAASAGFVLDAATAEVLPALLDALDRA